MQYVIQHNYQYNSPWTGKPMSEAADLHQQVKAHSYPLSCASSNRWVAFSSLAYSAQHDFN